MKKNNKRCFIQTTLESLLAILVYESQLSENRSIELILLEVLLWFFYPLLSSWFHQNSCLEFHSASLRQQQIKNISKFRIEIVQLQGQIVFHSKVMNRDKSLSVLKEPEEQR